MPYRIESHALLWVSSVRAAACQESRKRGIVCHMRRCRELWIDGLSRTPGWFAVARFFCGGCGRTTAVMSQSLKLSDVLACRILGIGSWRFRTKKYVSLCVCLCLVYTSIFVLSSSVGAEIQMESIGVVLRILSTEQYGDGWCDHLLFFLPSPISPLASVPCEGRHLASRGTNF